MKNYCILKIDKNTDLNNTISKIKNLKSKHDLEWKRIYE